MTDIELWERCAGGRAFGRVYGLRKQSSSHSVHYPPSDDSPMKLEVDNLHKKNDQFQEENKEIREKMGSMEIALQNLYKMIGGMKGMSPGQSCPPAPIHDSDSSSGSNDEDS